MAQKIDKNLHKKSQKKRQKNKFLAQKVEFLHFMPQNKFEIIDIFYQFDLKLKGENYGKQTTRTV